LGIVALDPDAFLVALDRQESEIVRAKLAQQAARPTCSHPLWQLTGITLARALAVITTAEHVNHAQNFTRADTGGSQAVHRLKAAPPSAILETLESKLS